MNENQNQPIEKESKKQITSKQVVAIIGIILLVLLYLITLIVAIFDKSTSGDLFRVCLFATAAIPLLIWIYVWLYKKLKERS